MGTIFSTIMVSIFVCLNFISVEYDIEPYYEQISGLKPHEQASRKDFPSTTQNIACGQLQTSDNVKAPEGTGGKDFPSTTQNVAYGQLQTSVNVPMNENVCYGYCGVDNKESTLLQSRNSFHSAERIEEESEHVYSTVDKNW